MRLLAECVLNACENEVRKPPHSEIRILVLTAEYVCIAGILQCISQQCCRNFFSGKHTVTCSQLEVRSTVLPPAARKPASNKRH